VCIAVGAVHIGEDRADLGEEPCQSRRKCKVGEEPSGIVVVVGVVVVGVVVVVVVGAVVVVPFVVVG